MDKKLATSAALHCAPCEHIRQLVGWMSQGVYEKEQIIAVALLCAVSGENMFLLGPPGTAKSMVASRLKSVFRNGKSFDYLMSRFSTPDEIFGPISISKLKNDDKYERLTAGYLPEADVVFLDEIWKAGPSIQNTLLTVINEHVFYNGGHTIRTPMKVLIAASNELPARDEGLEALWDRFLVRMVSNCIENDVSFFKMIKGDGAERNALHETLFITDDLYFMWQNESKAVGIHDSVAGAINALRTRLAQLEKQDGNHLRYYISDRRWRKAYRFMQTSAYLNGRPEIDMSDFLLLIHSFWNDVDCIPVVLDAVTASICDATVNQLNDIDKMIREILAARKQQPLPSAPQFDTNNNFAEYDYFYYLVENYPAGDVYFSKWDYSSLNDTPRDAIMFFDKKRNKNIIHALINNNSLDSLMHDASNLTRVKLQRCSAGIAIDGTPYPFRLNAVRQPAATASLSDMPICQRIPAIRRLFENCVSRWEQMITKCFTTGGNIFLSPTDYALANKTIGEVADLIKVTEVKLNNLAR